MEKLKIAILHYSCPPVIGGVESIIRSHASVLTKKGHDVHVIVGNGKQFRKNIEFTKIDELASQHKEIQDALNNYDKDPAAFNSYVEAITDKLSQALEGVDVCIVHNVLTMHFNLAFSWALQALAKQHKEICFVNWVHDCTVLNPDYEKIYNMKSKPWEILRAVVPNYQYVAISDLRHQQIVELYNIPFDEVAVIPDGIHMDSFLRLEPFVSELFLEEKLASKDIVAFTPTRIIRRKNLEMGVELVRRIKEQGKTIKWLISGAPDPHNSEALKYFKHLKKLIKKYDLKKDVVFLSEKYDRDLSDREITSIYRLTDVLFFISKQEGFGIPVIEAALSRVLVVISDIPPLVALGEDEAIYVPLDCADMNAKASEIIHQLYDSKSYRLFKRIIKTYPWKILFKKKIRPLLESLIGD